MALIKDTNPYPTPYTAQTSYNTTQSGSTTRVDGRASYGADQSTQTSFANDSVTLSAAAFEGADASFSSTTSNGDTGNYSSQFNAQARAGRFRDGQANSSGQIGGLSYNSQATGSTKEGAYAQFRSEVSRTDDSVHASIAGEAGAGVRFDGQVNNNIQIDGVGRITANTSGGGYAGAFAGGQTSLSADSDSVRFSSGFNYAAGAGLGMQDTLGFRKENGTGIDLTAGLSTSAGTSGSANIILGRDGQVTTLGFGVSGDLGIGGATGLQVSLHDDDSVAISGAALNGLAYVGGDTGLGRTAGTLGQFVSGDMQGLRNNPEALSYAAGITDFGNSVDTMTASVADAGSSAQSFARDAEEGVLASMGPNPSNLDIASAGVQIAASRVIGWGGGLLESIGLVTHRAGGGRQR